jgi:hypothetical protein
MKPIFELLKRVVGEYIKDPASIMNEVYNEPSGSYKMMIVEPVVKRAVLATEKLPFGSYVRVTGTTYTLQLLDKAYSASAVYRRNSIVTQGGFVWIAEDDNLTGTFDASKWRNVAPATVGPVTVTAGSVVCLGRYHNNCNAAGFLVEDDSEIVKVEK